MALTPRSGFSLTTSGQNNVPNEIPNSMADVLNNMPYVGDSNLNKLAIDKSSYPETTQMLAGFVKGKRTLVTYYRQLNTQGSNIRTNIADYATTRDVLNTEYQKIINLEITIPKAFDFTANNENASANISGEAVMYPNMNANIGDIFLTGTGDGRVGIFRISSVTPMTWRTDRVYAVRFSIQSFLDESDMSAIEGSVTITSVFSKENYLGGTAALLSETTYLQLQKIKAVRSNLARYFHQRFFDPNLCSYARPDGVYDPNLVQFVSNKITFEEVNIRAKNLYGKNPLLYNQSIWARIEDRYNTSLNGVSFYGQIQACREGRLGVFNTELHGRSVILPTSDASIGEFYLFTQAFYSKDTANMTAFEHRIYDAIIIRNAGDLTSLIADYLDTVYALPLDTQFYYIPLYMHLIDQSLQAQYRSIDAPGMGYSSGGI